MYHAVYNKITFRYVDLLDGDISYHLVHNETTQKFDEYFFIEIPFDDGWVGVKVFSSDNCFAEYYEEIEGYHIYCDETCYDSINELLNHKIKSDKMIELFSRLVQLKGGRE